MNTRIQKIEVLRQKLQQLEAAQQAIEARVKVAASKKNKVEDTRRKILLGAFTLDQIERSRCDFSRFELAGVSLDSWLTRPADRALFGWALDDQPNKTTPPPHQSPIGGG